jgi:hypothetical protein
MVMREACINQLAESQMDGPFRTPLTRPCTSLAVDGGHIGDTVPVALSVVAGYSPRLDLIPLVAHIATRWT